MNMTTVVKLYNVMQHQEDTADHYEEQAASQTSRSHTAIHV